MNKIIFKNKDNTMRLQCWGIISYYENKMR